jgi:hypothetical protein
VKRFVEVKDPRGGPASFKDEETGVFYSRIVGGVCFSGVDAYSPLHAGCVIGEEREKDFGSGMHILRILHEFSAPDVEELLDAAVLVQQRIKCRVWLTPLESPAMIRAVKWSRDRQALRLPRVVLSAPATRNFLVMHTLLQRRTETNKTMYFGADSQAAAQYVSVRKEEFHGDVGRFPAVAACLYALSGIDMRAERQGESAAAAVPAQGGY